ncbi:PAS domain-containing protein [Desulfolutivibrio sp.]|uniref:PAS domain-containing protein n=1 Tax=Desulfolutivibrio sp. TaxID=2773296 RepID=UPI002F963EDD
MNDSPPASRPRADTIPVSPDCGSSPGGGEAMYRLLAENMLDLICLHDLDGAYRYASPACREVMGVEPEALIGTRPGRFILPEDMPRVNEAFARFARGDESSRDITFRIRNAEGRLRWFEVRISLVRDATGLAGRPGLISVTRDITRRKAIQAALVRESQISRAMSHLSQGMMGSRGLAEICAATRRVAMLLTQSAQALACPVDQAALDGLDMSESAGTVPGTDADDPPCPDAASVDPGLAPCLARLSPGPEAAPRSRPPQGDQPPSLPPDAGRQ